MPEFYVRRQLYFTFFLSFYLERIVGSKPFIVSFFLSSILGFLCHSRHAPTAAYIEWAGWEWFKLRLKTGTLEGGFCGVLVKVERCRVVDGWKDDHVWVFMLVCCCIKILWDIALLIGWPWIYIYCLRTRMFGVFIVLDQATISTNIQDPCVGGSKREQ